MGGAQAIAALAYGTASVEPVDVIVGPGNLYVQEAKHQLSRIVGIDGFAGPSDLMVALAADAGPRELRLAALDMLAQAEHGEASLVARQLALASRSARRSPGSSSGSCSTVPPSPTPPSGSSPSRGPARRSRSPTPSPPSTCS